MQHRAKMDYEVRFFQYMQNKERIQFETAWIVTDIFW